MSNYPSMSYCMCQNTLLRLEQVLTAMREDGFQFLDDMSRDEKRAYDQLYHECAAFVRLAEDLADDEMIREQYDVDEDDVIFD